MKYYKVYPSASFSVGRGISGKNIKIEKIWITNVLEDKNPSKRLQGTYDKGYVENDNFNISGRTITINGLLNERAGWRLDLENSYKDDFNLSICLQRLKKVTFTYTSNRLTGYILSLNTSVKSNAMSSFTIKFWVAGSAVSSGAPSEKLEMAFDPSDENEILQILGDGEDYIMTSKSTMFSSKFQESLDTITSFGQNQIMHNIELSAPDYEYDGASTIKKVDDFMEDYLKNNKTLVLITKNSNSSISGTLLSYNKQTDNKTNVTRFNLVMVEM